jgi:hypothetical protein
MVGWENKRKNGKKTGKLLILKGLRFSVCLSVFHSVSLLKGGKNGKLSGSPVGGRAGMLSFSPSLIPAFAVLSYRSVL